MVEAKESCDRLKRARNGANVATMNEIDRKIVAKLQQDGRTSYTDLAGLVGLSVPAARQRVSKLLDSGIIRVVGVTDPQALGFPAAAMLGIVVGSDVEAVADRIASVDGVIYVVLCSGRFDLIVEVIAKDQQELLKLVNEGIRAADGVLSVETFVYFKTHTHRFDWEPPA